MSEPKNPVEPSDIFAVSKSIETLHTLRAPTQVVQFVPAVLPGPFRKGERFGDFVILRELGAGAFATVYLAHELSLDRRVALKISERRGLGEGQALAELEHPNIVQVYAQFTDPATGKHCLCLQYVPGTTLAQIIDRHSEKQPRPNSGLHILESIGVEALEAIPLDPAGIRDRETLASCSFAAAVCRFGVQMAEALDFAHRRGVLHCDIKPANILVNSYGRPLLADFNIAVDADKAEAGKSVGGTLGYMAPEQLARFLRQPTTDCVDERSDVYALGIVLFEFFTGRMPFEMPTCYNARDAAHDLLAKQQAFSPAVAWTSFGLPPVLERVIRRCLDPLPQRRYSNASELAEALANAFDVLAIEKQLPPGGVIARWAELRPFRMLLALTLLPQLISSFVNIAYNAIEIRLTTQQHIAFENTVLGYNLAAYPLTLFVMIRLLIPVVLGWRRIADLGRVSGNDVDRLRSQVLRLGRFGIILALAGWLPGGLVFPLLIDAMAGGVPWQVYAQFAVSFTLSGLIAVIYSHFGIQFVSLRVLYPRLANADTRTTGSLASELARASRWLVPFQCLAAVVPLVGAVLLVAFSGEMTLSYRLLVTSLIVLGMIGVGITVAVTRRLTQIVRTLGGEFLR